MESTTKIPAEKIALRYGGSKRWKAKRSDAWTSVEHAALQHYQASGWAGYAGEGALINVLITAASCPKPNDYHYGTDEIWIRRIEGGDIGSLLENIRNSNARRLRRTIEVMLGEFLPTWPFSTRWSPLYFQPLAKTRPYRLLRPWHLLEAYQALGPRRLAEIAEVFVSDPFTYKAGWPDITIWRKRVIEFKEIKAPNDTLRASQKRIIGDILIPLGFSVAVVNVIQSV